MWSAVDTSLPTWRARTTRYLLIYVALVVALVTVRALTSDVRRNLRDAQDQEATLRSERDNLALQLQSLENPQRVQEWAMANGMKLFAQATKEVAAFPPPHAAPVAAVPARTVEVRTEWK